jgi:hypothetical protein
MSNKKSLYLRLGASNHTDKERQSEDFYATEGRAAELLLEIEQFDKHIWECAAGQGHLSEVFKKAGHTVLSSDLIDRGYEDAYTNVDFLKCHKKWYGDIITNPPYKYAEQFIRKALELVEDRSKVAMFLKVQFLEGKARRKLFEEYPPIRVWVSSSRLLCAKNADFEGMIAGGGSAIAYAWFVWQKGYEGETILKWFN